MGVRMGAHSRNKPKCLLQIGNITLLDHAVDNLRRVGCSEIVVITGYKSEQIANDSVIKVFNDNYENNNILHSLMYARDFLDDSVIVSYSDIWVEPHIYDQLNDTDGEIVLAVDNDWHGYYEGRNDHPVAEAENVIFKDDNSIINLGKHIDQSTDDDSFCGEFLGLWKMSKAGAVSFKESFDYLNNNLDVNEPFQQAKEWQKSYITDMFKYLIDNDNKIYCSQVEKGWAELDTSEDYERLPKIAERQDLKTLMNRMNIS